MCQSYIGGDTKNVLALRNNIKQSTRFPIIFHFPSATSSQFQQHQNSQSQNTNYNSKTHRKLHMLSLENGTKLRPKGSVFNISGQISLLGFDLDPAQPVSTTAGLCRQQERLGPYQFPPKLRIFRKTPNFPPSQQGAVGLSQTQFLES